MKTSAFGIKIPYLGILGLEFKKTIFIFEINTLEFISLQSFKKKQNCLKLGPKMPYLGLFGLEV